MPGNVCQYASSANATSSSAGSEPVYATGAPDADANCNAWSGLKKSWNTASWAVKASITLSYAQPVYAKNFTIFGDYDMCFSKMWLKNSATGQQIQVFSGFETTCKPTKKFSGDFLADTVILETCGWSWSSTDAVQLCGIVA